MIRADKKLGQHFLKDKSVIKKICDDHIGQYDVIVEVGPGPGSLSVQLAKIDRPLYFIEKDFRFVDHLATLTDEDKIFHQDALEFNWNDFIKVFGLEDKKIWLVSNLPYNVGTVLFVQFLQISQIKFMTLMFQKEVGDKTYLKNTKNEMSGLLVLSLNFMEPQLLCKVLPGAFHPPPKVNSNVISFTRKESPDIAIDGFEKLNSFTRNLFSNKRKQIGHVLKKYPVFQKIKENAIIDTTRRAESLSYEEVLRLFEFIDQENGWA